MSLLDLGPGRQDFRYRAGNTFSTEVDWSIDMSGYAVTSELVTLVAGVKIADVPTTAVDAAAGRWRLAFPVVSIPGTYGWSQTWTAPNGDKRTGLAGYVEVIP